MSAARIARGPDPAGGGGMAGMGWGWPAADIAVTIGPRPARDLDNRAEDPSLIAAAPPGVAGFSLIRWLASQTDRLATSLDSARAFAATVRRRSHHRRPAARRSNRPAPPSPYTVW